MSDAQDRKHGREEDSEFFDEQPPTKHFCEDYNDTLTVLVGPEEQSFVVHRELICAKSKFFRIACAEDHWREGREKTVRLPETRPRYFKRYLDWVYCGRIASEFIPNDDVNPSAGEVAIAVGLYFLGDVLDDKQLRNRMMGTLVADAGLILVPAVLQGIWERIVPSSPLRKLILDKIIMQVGRAVFAEYMAKYPHEVVREVAVRLAFEFDPLEIFMFNDRLDDYLEMYLEK